MSSWTIRGLFFALAALPLAVCAADDRDQPSSRLQDGTEIFSIGCVGMPQETTIDMDQCLAKQLAQVGWVKDKYLTAALTRIQQDNKDTPESQRQISAAFTDESKAWDTLIDKASQAMSINYAAGTIRGAMASTREIKLTELQVHDIWQNWLRFGDSTPPILPEPEFKSAE